MLESRPVFIFLLACLAIVIVVCVVCRTSFSVAGFQQGQWRAYLRFPDQSHSLLDAPSANESGVKGADVASSVADAGVQQAAETSAPLVSGQDGEESTSAKPFSYDLLSKGQIKVYVYDMPPAFTYEMLTSSGDQDCGWMHTYAEEYVIHQQLLKSDIRTLDPNEANLFYVPMYLFDDCAGPGQGKCRRDAWICKHAKGYSFYETPGLALAHVAQQWPYFNRSQGSDHAMAITHDNGRCLLSAQERERFVRVHFLLPSAEFAERRGCFRPGYDVSIPPMLGRRYLDTVKQWKVGVPQGPLAMFVGKFGLTGRRMKPQRVKAENFFGCSSAPTCNSTQCPGKTKCKGQDVVVWCRSSIPPADYHAMEEQSRYHLHLEGSVFVSNRLYSTIALGRVPVLFENGHLQAFELAASDVIPWDDIAVRIPEQFMSKSRDFLSSISPEDYVRRQSLMRNVAEAVLYRDPPVRGGALDIILQRLVSLLKRSTSVRDSYDVRTGAPLRASSTQIGDNHIDFSSPETDDRTFENQ